MRFRTVASVLLLSLLPASGEGIARAESPSPTTLVPPPRAHTFGIRRVTSRELALLLPGRRLKAPAGIGVALLHELDDPATSRDDDEVTLVAVDQDSGMLCTNFSLMRAGCWTGSDWSEGRLLRPEDVAIDRDGNVAIADTGNGRVVLLKHEAGELLPIAAFGGYLEPTGIAACGRGDFLVCDRSRGVVSRLHGQSGVRVPFGMEVSFDRPIDVATIPDDGRLLRGRKRVVAVVDRDGERLRIFGVSGELHATFAARQLDLPGARFRSIDLDYLGNIYATDPQGHRIHKFRHDLLPLHSFGSRGTEPGEFLSPWGIAIHRPLGQVFLTEEGGGRYEWVGTDILDFQASTADGSTAFSFLLTEDSSVTFRVLNVSGKEVAVLISDTRHAAGPQFGTWDGTDSSGARVPVGVYIAEIRARATYASRSTFEKRTIETFVR
ncbi:MAG: FlgD immunoglobulin-like domain containing protein [Gemmatimonadota bacterium]|nr:FlgD immunoglobulin-like domain containing protein [Gemmatimonadota bacterium]